ncbi:MAG: DUF2157 domain-containing protein [Treponema sp.]|nr:DUF2157 domain-containing protein [Treponema sp.]
MNVVYVNWLLEELKVLVQKGVISQDVSNKMSSYYRQEYERQVAETQIKSTVEKPQNSSDKSIYDQINSRSKTSSKKESYIRAEHIPVLLSIIAGVLISAGIISLIAYNWHVIPRTVKAAVAFVLLLGIQSFGCIVFFRKSLFEKAHLRELSSLLWSLLFGGVVAFISQICRLPGNTSGFIFIWAASSILLTYSFKSIATFFIALVQICSYAIVCRTSGGAIAGFYLLFATLVPFAWAKKYTMRIMLVIAAFMLAVVIEKCIPGLWIVCSVSYAVLCFVIGQIRKDEFIINSSAIGLCILLQVLSINGLWRDIGWQHFRLSYFYVGSILDCVLALCLTASSIALPLVPVLRRKAKVSYTLIYPLCSFIVALLYIIYSCSTSAFQEKSLLAPTVMVCLFSIIFFVHVVYAETKKVFSWILLGFVVTASMAAQFENLIFAIAVFVIMLEGMILFRTKKDFYVHLLSFVIFALVTLSSDFYLQDCSTMGCVMLAFCMIVSLCLIAKSGCIRQSLDVMFLCVALVMPGVIRNVFDVNEDALRFAFLYTMIIACVYDFKFLHYGNNSLPQFYWTPFAIAILHFFCAGLVNDFTVLPFALFLFLVEAAATYRINQNETEGKIVRVGVRILLSALLFSVVWLPQENCTCNSMPTVQLTVTYLCYVAVAVILFVLSKKIKKSLDVLLIAAVLIANSLSGNNVVIYTTVLLAAVFAFIMWWRKGIYAYLPYLLLIIALQVLFPLQQIPYYAFGGHILFLMLFPLCTCVHLYVEDRYKEKLSPVSTICEVACAILAFCAAFSDTDKSYKFFELPDLPYIVFSLFGTLLYAFVTLHPFVSVLRNKKKCNYVMAGYSILVFLMLIFVDISAFNDALRTAFCGSFVYSAVKIMGFVCIFLTAGYHIANAYRSGSLAVANVAGVYAALAICIKFFSDDFGFVVKGVLFIVLGIAMLALNLVLLRLNNKKAVVEE